MQVSDCSDFELSDSSEDLGGRLGKRINGRSYKLEEKLNMIAQFWKIFKVYLNHAIYQMICRTLESTWSGYLAMDRDRDGRRAMEG
jgi:hypothetical protein